MKIDLHIRACPTVTNASATWLKGRSLTTEVQADGLVSAMRAGRDVDRNTDVFLFAWFQVDAI